MHWLAKMQHFPESNSGKKSSCFITNGRHPIRQSVHWPEIGHWPNMHCQISMCMVRLCLNKDRNCFNDYHN